MTSPRLACLLAAGLLGSILGGSAMAEHAGAPEDPAPSDAKAAAAAGGRNTTDVPLRFAVHPGFDRLVLALPQACEASWRQDGASLSVTVCDDGRIVGDMPSGRRLRSAEASAGRMALQLAPGTRARVWRLESRLVIDVMEPPRPSPQPVAPHPVAPSRPGSRSPPSTVLAHASLPRVTPAVALPGAEPSGALARVRGPALPKIVTSRAAAQSARAADAAAPPEGLPNVLSRVLQAPAPVTERALPTLAQDSASLPSGAAVTLLPRDSDLPGPAMLLPIARDVGVAAFARAGQGHAVLDAALPLDLSALKDDPVFGGVTERLLPDGMHLHLPLGPASQLRLVRRPDGLAVIVVQSPTPASPLAPIASHLRAGSLAFDAQAPGHVVTIDDEVTGGRLLVGTQRVTGQRVASARQSAEFALVPTWQGLVVAPVSDRLSMRTIAGGFELAVVDTPALAVSWPEQPTGTWPDGRALTRLFDFPDLSPESLNRRLGQALRDAALGPRPARYAPRVAAATAMLAQGMDVEAAAVLHVADADDPSHRDDHLAAGLSAVATWLSAKAGGVSVAVPDPAFDLGDLGDSDEAAFWRALLQPEGHDAAARAAALAPTWPLAMTYSPTLRHGVVRDIASVLLAGGQDKALAALLATCPDHALDLPRAQLLGREGRTEEALAALDRIAAGPDRLVRAEAAEAAVELRLATHRLDLTAAADSLDRQLYAWRDEARELRLRMRVAALRAQAGAWRAALAALRQSDELFPQAHAQIRDAEVGVVADLLRGDRAARLSPIELVALADEAADLLTAADAQGSLAPILVDKLLALDLPERAEPVLRRLFARAGAGSVKAEIGVRLAGLIADGGDGGAALAVLDDGNDALLSDALVARRKMLRATLLSAAGRGADALAALAGLNDHPAGLLRATIMERQHDWADAAETLRPLLQGADFDRLPEAARRDGILRLARDESEAGDMDGLRQLRAAQQARFTSGRGAELFAVLTGEPVRATADIPRSARELAAIQSLPGKLGRGQPF